MFVRPCPTCARPIEFSEATPKSTLTCPGCGGAAFPDAKRVSRIDAEPQPLFDGLRIVGLWVAVASITFTIAIVAVSRRGVAIESVAVCAFAAYAVVRAAKEISDHYCAGPG